MTDLTSRVEQERERLQAVERLVPLAESERTAIFVALKLCRGSREETAQRLGISVSTLYRRLAEYQRAWNQRKQSPSHDQILCGNDQGQMVGNDQILCGNVARHRDGDCVGLRPKTRAAENPLKAARTDAMESTT